MKFYKFHGTGNDFVMIENCDGKITLSPEEISQLCDRHFGIGADGVILVEARKNGGDFFMNYWNSDGSPAEMCGNGTRCTAHFAREILRFKKNTVALETRAGIKIIEIHKNNLFTVNMGTPDFEKFSDFPPQPQIFENIRFSFVSMGNPHAVGFFDNKEDATYFLDNTAPTLETNTSLFPNKINISVAWKKGENHFGAKTHERGCGQTLACGTAMSGLFSFIVGGWKLVSPNEKVQIDIPGGTLFFTFNKKGEILMTGSSTRVFEGEI